ncbi:hypothetical protein XH94_33920 [Bradyrhizobium zhanjiangense]|uniref:Uncharacterized protein n=1 Tax=Bradyrhizobium zhanjiangense TaxID=1325107 RepID=A0A4Q0S8G4_9BRAD|nr:hypothetical protein XH94_33920 [Bradyrhizobium zhanjiangense]
MMGMKYSFDARLEFARRLSAIFPEPGFKFADKFEVTFVHCSVLILLLLATKFESLLVDCNRSQVLFKLWC